MTILVQTALSAIYDDAVDIVAPYLGTPKAAIFWSSGATVSISTASFLSADSSGFSIRQNKAGGGTPCKLL